MKVTIKHEALKSLASKAAAVADGKAIQTLGSVLLRADGERLHAYATDLYTTVRASAPCTVDGGGTGPVAVPAKQLSDVVVKLAGEDVTLELDGTKLRLRCGRSRYHLPTLLADDVPALPEAPSRGVEVDGGELLRLLDGAEPAMSTDDSRPHMCCVRLELTAQETRAVATDGHRLVIYAAPRQAGEKLEVSVPPKGVRLLRALEKAPATLSSVGGNFFVTQGDTTWGVKLVEELFIPYEKVVPTKCTHVARVERDALTDAAKRVRSIARAGVTFAMGDGILSLSADDGDGADGLEEVVAHVKAGGEPIGVNVAYLLDALSKCPDDEVEIRANGPLDPVVVKGETYTHVIMPLRK